MFQMTYQNNKEVSDGNPLPVSDSNTSAGLGIVTVDVSTADQSLSTACRAFMVGAAGDVALVMVDGSTGTLRSLSPGVIYPFMVTKFLHNGTTATELTAIL
jgi:hypothetical protein